MDFSSFAFDVGQFKEIAAAVVGVPTFAYGWYWAGRRKGSAADKAIIQNLQTEVVAVRQKVNEFQRRHETLEATVKDAKDFWVKTPERLLVDAHQAALRTSMPIICVVNFKGGVGKTTICANLAAHFAEVGKRVLLIDCDYQGSLSDTVLSHARVDKFTANSHLLLESGHDKKWLREAAERLSGLNSNLWIYPAYYGYSRAEITMMFRWLIGEEDDIRFNLSNYLQSAPFKEEPATNFDMVLIDAPPRLLTGAVNALTAATHVLIPTILDGQSHLATLNTLSAIKQFQRKLNPTQRILGIVPSMVTNATGYTPLEQEYIVELERQIPEFYGSLVPVLKNRPILHRSELAKAGGSEVAVSSSSNAQPARQVREMFANLADYVSANIEWRNPVEDEPKFALPGQAKQRAAS